MLSPELSFRRNNKVYKEIATDLAEALDYARRSCAGAPSDRLGGAKGGDERGGGAPDNRERGARTHSDPSARLSTSPVSWAMNSARSMMSCFLPAPRFRTATVPASASRSPMTAM